MKNIEIITLVYRSLDYCRFITDQLLEHAKATDWMVTCRVIANDPEIDGLLDYPREQGLAVSLYNDPDPEDYYLNRVYRCWNWGAKSCAYDNVCFVNSDMAFSEGWLDNLLKHHNGTTIPTSRLIESEKMPSGRHGIGFHLGRHPNEFDPKNWKNVANYHRADEVHSGGLFMPVVFDTKKFLKVGGYPEGNIYEDGIGTCNGEVKMSGDAHFFYKTLASLGMVHITPFDSLVYHIQEGEMDE